MTTFVYTDPKTKKVNVVHVLDKNLGTLTNIVPAGATPVQVEDSNCVCKEDPNMVFLGAWNIDSKDKLSVDMVKARDIHLDHIREGRNDRLNELDKEAIIALGKNDKKSLKDVESRKQILRDLPSSIVSSLKKAKTPRDLANIVPPEIV